MASCVDLLPGRTYSAVSNKFRELRGPFTGLRPSADNRRLLDFVKEDLITEEICTRLPHRRRRYIDKVIERYQAVRSPQVSSNRARWSTEQDSIISRGMALGKRPSDIAAELPETSTSLIDRRMLQLAQNGEQIKRYPRRAWLAEDDKVLIAMYEAGELSRTIASRLQRSTQSVENRHAQLRKREEAQSSNSVESKPSKSKGV